MALINGQRVRVYFNLRKRVLSVMDVKTRKVIAHCDYISLDNVKFIVSQAGLKRVRAERRKQVIAFVEGNFSHGHGKVIDNPEWTTAYFNPYKVDHFVVGEQPIHETDSCYIVQKSIYVKQPQQEVAYGNV